MGLDLEAFGQRLRHLRQARGLTLAELASGSAGRRSLSLLENGKREPKLSLLESLAAALVVPVEELLRRQPPNRRAQLEIALEEAQRDPVYAELGLPPLKVGARVPNDVLEHLVGLYGELRRQRAGRPPPRRRPGRPTRELRADMRERGNYFAEIEQAAAEALAAVGYRAGALSQSTLLAHRHPLRLHRAHVQDLPRSARSVTDLRNRRIYVEQEQSACTRRGRCCCRRSATSCSATAARGLRRLPAPADRGQLLRRRRAGARAARGALPAGGQGGRELSVEDLRDVFARLLRDGRAPLHQPGHPSPGPAVPLRPNDAGGIIYKAYENDGMVFPADEHGAIEGQRCAGTGPRGRCSPPTASRATSSTPTRPPGTYFCWAQVVRPERTSRSPSACRTRSRAGSAGGTRRPAPSRAAPTGLLRQPAGPAGPRWDRMAWPSARAHSHVLAALPPGAFAGVDLTEVYAFLDRHSAGDGP